jgi:hypothetical protein
MGHDGGALIVGIAVDDGMPGHGQIVAPESAGVAANSTGLGDLDPGIGGIAAYA